MTYESSIALRYLRSKRKEKFISFTTWAAAVGIAIGVMALIVVIAVMTGFQDEIRDRILGVNPHMLISDLSGEIVNPDQVVAAVKNTEGVAAAFPFITFQGLAQSGQRVSGVVVKGMDPKDLSFLSHLVKEGSIDALREKGTVLVAKELARELGVKTGDVFTILVPFGGISPMGATPETVRVRVGGIFQTGMYDIDNMLMVMSLVDVQALLGGGITGIEVKLKDVYAADTVRAAVAQKLGLRYIIRTWTEMNRNLFSALKLEKIAMFIILVLIIFVASFNIISSLVMTVMEKKKDIAILKAMGAKNRSIMRIFMAEGLTIGVFGALVGSVIGYLMCVVQNWLHVIKLSEEVYTINVLPMKISVTDVLLIASVTIVICLLATLYPSYKATKIDPVETLRYE
ncbi:MAG: lipoprotein-releasing ABC transporter permease subunit [Syntrophorhabdales bacterium]|jgi:lipoprotein-releasing system permease protein